MSAPSQQSFFVPLLILLLWVAMAIIYYTVGLDHTVSLVLVLASVAWFVGWLIKASRA